MKHQRIIQQQKVPIQAVWNKFFEASDSGDQITGPAREKIREMTAENGTMMNEVKKIPSVPGTRSHIYEY